MEMMTSYELGSPARATVALVVFLLLSLGISLAVYGGLVRRATRRSVFPDASTLQAPVAALISTAVFALLFGALYATVLQGFYRVELLDGEVRLHYLFPAHTVTLSRLALAQAERIPAHKGRWHLRLHTFQGDTYQSALANDRAVLQSWEGLNAYLEHPGRP